LSQKWIAFIVFIYAISVYLGATYDQRNDLCQPDTGGTTHCYETTRDYLLSMKNAIVHASVILLNRFDPIDKIV
jgi:hypothetical protein